MNPFFKIRGGMLLVIFCFTTILTFAQKPVLERIDPPHWWTGMQNDTLYLLVKGQNLTDVFVMEAVGIAAFDVALSDNQDYLHLWLLIGNAAPNQKIKFELGTGKNKLRFQYELKNRNPQHGQMQGLSAKDFIYSITPDRFANGNVANDVVKGMRESVINRNAPAARHGGDIAGILQHLDYIKSTGATAILSNSLLENNQPNASYDGQAITDNFKIDPRFGTNQLFYSLVQTGHQKAIKTILDVVYNHIGNEHYLVQAPPDSAWFNWWPTFTKTNHTTAALHDPHAATADLYRLQNGWLDAHLADLNQKHASAAKWCLQNSIWLIEEFDLDAFRIGASAYTDQNFVAHLHAAVLAQYPNFFIFAEKGTQNHTNQPITHNPYFSHGNPNKPQSATDFHLQQAISEGLQESFGPATGISKVYYALAADSRFNESENFITFLDNLQVGRFYGVMGQDLNKFRMGVGMLFTLRGIPSMLYGTEILMAETQEFNKAHQDFPGGWPTDSANKFTLEGRTALENQAFGFVKGLANFRKNSPALTEGKLVQFVPEEGVYVYFRVHASQTIMVVVNTNAKIQAVNMERFAEVAAGFNKTRSILTGFESPIFKYLNTSEMSISVFELLKQ